MMSAPTREMKKWRSKAEKERTLGLRRGNVEGLEFRRVRVNEAHGSLEVGVEALLDGREEPRRNQEESGECRVGKVRSVQPESRESDNIESMNICVLFLAKARMKGKLDRSGVTGQSQGEEERHGVGRTFFSPALSLSFSVLSFFEAFSFLEDMLVAIVVVDMGPIR